MFSPKGEVEKQRLLLEHHADALPVGVGGAGETGQPGRDTATPDRPRLGSRRERLRVRPGTPKPREKKGPRFAQKPLSNLSADVHGLLAEVVVRFRPAAMKPESSYDQIGVRRLAHYRCGVG